MAAKGKKISKEHKDALRAAAVARHAERKAAGLPSPFGTPYAKDPEPVVPEPEAVPVAKSWLGTPKGPPTVVPMFRDGALEDLPIRAPRPPDADPVPSPRVTFTLWLRGKAGIEAADTRMSRDGTRFASELEDKLWIAWQAGFNAATQ